MNLKVLFMILIYYGVLIIFLLSPVSPLKDSYTVDVELNSTSLTAGEVDSGGLFGTGVDFGRFASLISVGVGLPSDTPSWFTFIFALWQSIFLIFTIGFFISSIWNG